MALEDIVDVQISVSAVTPSRANFGMPLVLAQHGVGAGANLVEEVRSLNDVVSLGHAVNSIVYRMLTPIFSQRPRPVRALIGKRTTPVVQVVDFIPTNTTEGFVYRWKVGSENLTYTVPASATPTIVATGIRDALNGATGAYSAALAVGNTRARMTADAAGTMFAISGLQYPELKIEDQTSAGSLSTEITNVVAENSNWYSLMVDTPSAAAITAAATAIETTERLFVSDTHDTRVTDGGDAADIGSMLQASGFARTFLQYHPDHGAYSSGALMSSRLTASPGSDTWAHKTLRGVRAYNLRAAQETALTAKNVNFYTNIDGVGDTMWGKTPSGEYVDVVRGIDWLISFIRSEVFAALRSGDRVEYTDAGIEKLRKVVERCLDTAADDNRPYRLIVPGSYTVTAPKEADVSEADKQERLLPDIQFDGDIRGSVHGLAIRGTLRR